MGSSGPELSEVPLGLECARKGPPRMRVPRMGHLPLERDLRGAVILDKLALFAHPECLPVQS